ncbi:glycoside hydrolase family 5 protein [Haloferula sp. A504]|uniref:glycoside hydrolase family 5 protein n=1 Tax=Haloferula sp. A504 TaxID=3373601 RepID=UPI0031C6C339|nr:glycoside hydrolase family 5 protein [Verrucomicrobiaceae bacterium E54]
MVVALGISVMTVSAAELPVRIAEMARLHLTVPADQPPLKRVEVSPGSASEGSWLEDPEARRRLTDVSMPIDWWRWTEVCLSFVPAADGVVDLSLNGPWAEASPGVLWRQEVLWDDFEAKGAEFTNGDFTNGIAGWNSPWADYPAEKEWPMNGRGLAASWHGRPLVQRLEVKGTQLVELKFRVRAAVPEGFEEPKRLAADTPAHRACAKLKRGVNLGNGWEAEPGTWGLKYTVEDIDRIADAGFDHIRVPVAWHFHFEKGAIGQGLLAELEPVLHRAIERGLFVLLDWHHFEALCEKPELHRREFVDGWKRIAVHFSDWPPQLFFELLNEPNGALDGDVLNEIHAEALAGIRESNPKRIVVANPGGWSVVGSLGRMRLPDEDERVIVSVHCYDPFEFTHQGAGWVGLEPLKGVVFPGPPAKPLAMPPGLKDRHGFPQWLEDYNTMPSEANPCSAREVERLMAVAAAWSGHFGRPVHLGEFGAFQTGELGSRKRYARAVRKAAEKHGIPWCWWEWKAGFGCWDAEQGRSVLIDDLIGH